MYISEFYCWIPSQYKLLTQLLHLIFFSVYYRINYKSILHWWYHDPDASYFCNFLCRECTCISEGIGEDWQWDNEIIQKSSFSESNIRMTGCKTESSILENNEFDVPSYCCVQIYCYKLMPSTLFLYGSVSTPSKISCRLVERKCYDQMLVVWSG